MNLWTYCQLNLPHRNGMPAIHIAGGQEPIANKNIEIRSCPWLYQQSSQPAFLQPLGHYRDVERSLLTATVQYIISIRGSQWVGGLSRGGGCLDAGYTFCRTFECTWDDFGCTSGPRRWSRVGEGFLARWTGTRLPAIDSRIK